MSRCCATGSAGSVEKSEGPERDFPENGGVDVVGGDVAVFFVFYLAEILVLPPCLDDIFLVYSKIPALQPAIFYRVPAAGKLAAEKCFSGGADFGCFQGKDIQKIRVVHQDFIRFLQGTCSIVVGKKLPDDIRFFEIF